jgi:uncharacterized protein
MIVLVVLVIVLLFSLKGLAGFYTDYLWFDSVGQGSTWSQLLAAKIAPAIVFTVIFFVIMYANLLIADRIAPKYRSMGPEDEIIERYQQAVSPYRGRLRVGVALFFALVAAVGVSSQWQQWVLFTHRVDFGVKDPQFHKDIGFYVFQLPFLKFIVQWLFAGLVIVLIITAIAHYLNGGIRFQSPFQRVTPQVKAHLSVILAIMALVKASQYFFIGRYELNFSSRGVIEGASATDVKIQAPALNVLAAVAVIAAVLFVWNIFRRGWVLPVIAVGLWAFVSLAIGTIYPAYYQKFRVDPNEYQSEKRYIGRNIAATRAAFDLKTVDVTNFPYADTLQPAVVNANRPTIDNARLWDPDVIKPTYQTLQGLQTFYKVDDVDVDRYVIDGQTRQVTIAARELNSAELPSQSWVNRHLVYTHGYGSIASPTNSATSQGNPNFFVSDVPPKGQIKLTNKGSQLYFGENLSGYTLVGANQSEFNYPRSGAQDATTRYTGTDGVKLSSYLRRFAFALRFGDVNTVISGQVNSHTRLIFQRDIKDRVTKLAPFLKFDADPYPVVFNGKTTWVLDGFTTTSRYPYSQSTNGEGGLDGSFNYVRNSVKATVDAYNGTVKFYVIDRKDPIIRSYRKAFPDLFTDFSKMPAGLRAHLRYPEDLFKTQTTVFGGYHVTEPRRFYDGNAKWLVSPEPGAAGPNVVTSDTSNKPQNATSTSQRIAPYYLYIRLPGDKHESFLILRPFVPVSQDNKQTRLVSFMVARADPGEYGKLSTFVMPQDQSVLGPVQADNQINSTAEISRQITLLGQQKSALLQGSLQVIPVGDSLIYVRPLYVQREGASGYPTFRFVVVLAPNKQPVLAATVNDGLNQIFGNSPAAPTPGQTTPTPSTGSTVQDLLNQASAAFNSAQAALKNGDLAEYQKDINEAGKLIDQARQAAAATPTAPSTPTTPTTPTTGPSTPASSAASGSTQQAGRRR